MLPGDILPKDPPSDKVLIRTEGNTLQAVSRQALEQNVLVAASVPESLAPGRDNLLIRAPDGSDRVISVVVPKGARPGHVFLVKMPAEEAAPIVAMGIPVEEADLLDTDSTPARKYWLRWPQFMLRCSYGHQFRTVRIRALMKYYLRL
jgi:hypothetical protein